MVDTQSLVILKDFVVNRPALVLGPDVDVCSAAKAMQESKKGAVLVSDGKKLFGIFTERDLVNRVVAPGKVPSETRLREVMTTELVVVHPEDHHHAALSVMVHHQVRHLPVVEGDRVVGMVSRRQLMALDNALMEAAFERREASRLFL